MDLELRHLLREYVLNPTDGLAIEIFSRLIRVGHQDAIDAVHQTVSATINPELLSSLPVSVYPQTVDQYQEILEAAKTGNIVFTGHIGEEWYDDHLPCSIIQFLVQPTNHHYRFDMWCDDRLLGLRFGERVLIREIFQNWVESQSDMLEDSGQIPQTSIAVGGRHTRHSMLGADIANEYLQNSQYDQIIGPIYGGLRPYRINFYFPPGESAYSTYLYDDDEYTELPVES